MVKGIKFVPFSKIKLGQEFVRVFGNSSKGERYIRTLEIHETNSADSPVIINAIQLSGTAKGCYSAMGDDIQVIPL